MDTLPASVVGDAMVLVMRHLYPLARGEFCEAVLNPSPNAAWYHDGRARALPRGALAENQSIESWLAARGAGVADMLNQKGVCCRVGCENWNSRYLAQSMQELRNMWPEAAKRHRPRGVGSHAEFTVQQMAKLNWSSGVPTGPTHL